MVDSCDCNIERIAWFRETGRSFFSTIFFNFDRASIEIHVCQKFRFFCSSQSLGLTVLIFVVFSLVRVLVCHSENSRNSRPPSS